MYLYLVYMYVPFASSPYLFDEYMYVVNPREFNVYVF